MASLTSLAHKAAERGTPPLQTIGSRTRIANPAQLEELREKVRALRPRLVDAWETTALIESLGYTDGRVQREFGFADTLEAGEYLHGLSADDDVPEQRW